MTERSLVVRLVSLLVIISLIGCTSLRPIEATPEELQQRIRQEDIVEVGDRVRIFTADEKEHRFLVTAVDADEVRGKDVSVPIDSIVALQTRGISIGRTALLAGGVVGVMLFVLVAVAPAMILAASAP